MPSPPGEGLKELIMENNAILSALSARKSVRVFPPDPVTPDERAAILNAAFQAPTAGNQQLYTILDITDPALKATLADLCDHQPFIAGAPLVLVFLADCRRWLNAYHAAGITDARKPGAGDLMLAVADTCIAAQNAVVAAALDALVPLIERSNRWARIENVEVTPLPVKEHEYGFGERSGE